jgi:1-deoxyxylulose-5-phosphate synthase
MTRPTHLRRPQQPAFPSSARVTTRREFLGRAAAIAGAAAFSPALLAAAEARATRTAVDQVPLGKTGLKLSRLGFGTGTNSGHVQHALGQQAFSGLIRYAFDQGVTFFDCSQSYATFPWLGGAIKGLPREKVFLQSKIPGQPPEVLKVIDHHRKVFNTDYLDSLLVHCMVKGGWTDDWKRVMDAFEEAKDKKWIRSKGVSCHSLPALRDAATSDWVEVNLVRVNPQARYIDGEEPKWTASGNNVAPVVEQLKTMHAKGHGIIGMKIFGNDGFVHPNQPSRLSGVTGSGPAASAGQSKGSRSTTTEDGSDDRERSIRFAMAQPEIDAVVIGFKSRQEIDEAIGRINRALAAS